MNNEIKLTANTSDVTLLVVRIFLGAIVFAHGAQKLLGWFGGYGFEGTMEFFTHTIGVPYLLGVLIIYVESIGMIALMMGLFSRFISGFLILIMLGAVFSVHGQFGFFMNWSGAQGGEGFEYHLLVIALSLVLTLNGSGVYAADHLLKKIAVNKLSRQTT